VAIFNLLINDLKRNKEAFEYCLIAAEHGILDAQNELYKLYVYGHGCIRDEEKAKRWYMRTKRLKKNSNIEFDIDYKENFEEKVKMGKKLCDFEEKSSINAEGLTIKERLERMLKSVNHDAILNKLFENSEKIKTSLESRPIFKSSILESIADWLPILITKAENGSIIAQNYLTSLKMYMEADKLIFEKKYEKAIKILRESIKFNEVLSFDYKNLSQILELIDQNNIDGKFIKARILGNDIKGSISFMQRCTKQHSNEADFHHLLGCMYGFDKNYRGALIQFERALELEYRTDWLYDKATAMRSVYLKKKDLIKVVKAYQIFLDSNQPDHRKVPEALYSIALCYLVIEDFSTARVYWEKANNSELDRLPCFRPVEEDFMPKASLDFIFLTKIIPNNPKSCSFCGKKAPKFKCPCKNAFYCDSNCQKLNWMHHKKECNIKKP